MLEQKFTAETSKMILQIYRHWTEQEENSNEGSGEKIVIDDLANHRESIEGGLNDVKALFQEVLAHHKDHQPIKTLKIKNSLAYLESLGQKPSRKSIEDSGAELIDVPDSYFFESQKKIAELEATVDSLPMPSPVEGTNLDILGQAIVQSGYSYLKSKCPQLFPIDISFVPPDGHMDFASKVKTDRVGSLYCVLPSSNMPAPNYILLLIHEILGHGLHFSQIRQNTDLQKNFPHLLCFSVHTHENFLLEAVAQLITTRLLLSDWDLPYKKRIQLSDLKELRIRASIHQILPKLLDGEMSLDEAASLHAELCPGKLSNEVLKGRYASLLSSTFTSKVLVNYFSSYNSIQPLLSLKDQDFYKILPELLSQYFTPELLRDFVRNTCDSKA